VNNLTTLLENQRYQLYSFSSRIFQLINQKIKFFIFLSQFNQLQSSYNSLESPPSSTIKNSHLEMKHDIDIDDLFKGDGPKYLQLESYNNFKPPISILSDDKYYVEEHQANIAYSKSKSRRNFAAHLTKLVFTPRERLESNCNGRFGKKALDSNRLNAIRNTLFKYYPCKQSTLILNGDQITSGDHDENNVWVRDCIPAIDESNRVLKKQLISWYKKNQNNSNLKHNIGKMSNMSGASISINSNDCINLIFDQKYNLDHLVDQELDDESEEDQE